jgi:hypothetical protein
MIQSVILAEYDKIPTGYVVLKFSHRLENRLIPILKILPLSKKKRELEAPPMFKHRETNPPGGAWRHFGDIFALTPCFNYASY